MSLRIKIDNSMHALEPAWEDIKREFTVACAQSASASRSRVLYELNQLNRRFRQYDSEPDWVRLVIEGAGAYCRQAALFVLENEVLNLRAQVNLEVPEVLSFPPGWAGAFETVCTSKEPVTALRTPTEVTEALSTQESGERAHLFPITNGSRLAAVLFASDGDDTDVNALELISGIASSVLEREANSQLHSQIAILQQPLASQHQEEAPKVEHHAEPVSEMVVPEAETTDETAELVSVGHEENSYQEMDIAPVRAGNLLQMPSASYTGVSQMASSPRRHPAERAAIASVGGGAAAAEAYAPTVPLLHTATLPAWADLDEHQRQLHMRAQRFARVTVAEMQLAKPEACRAGREQGDFYLFLNKEIDKAREIYRQQFMTISSMVDYLHLELVQTAVEGDERKLGADYPGQLV
jgi:DNA-binding transcriptional regulator YdaS (Cro superfamily)